MTAVNIPPNIPVIIHDMAMYSNEVVLAKTAVWLQK